MAINIPRTNRPLPVLRDTFLKDVSTQDYVNAAGFIATVASSGTSQVVIFRTIEGTEDQERNIAAGGIIGAVGGVPVALQAVRSAASGDGTVSSIEVGIL